MRVFITLYDKTGTEPALSGWVTVRTLTGAQVEAHAWRERHVQADKHACTLGTFTLSRRVAGREALRIDKWEDFHNGERDNQAALTDSVVG